MPNLKALAVAVKKRIISTTFKNAYFPMTLDLILDAFSRRTSSYFLYLNYWPIEPAMAIFPYCLPLWDNVPMLTLCRDFTNIIFQNVIVFKNSNNWLELILMTAYLYNSRI